MKVLITAGGTKEFIDGVRYLGNISSGQTGATLADELSAKGHSVVWLGADSAMQPQVAQARHVFTGFDDLAEALKTLLSEHHFDVVFHAAAVSDYKVTNVLAQDIELPLNRQQKISSEAETLQLTLTKTPKLINQLMTWSSNKELKVIGFKLTNTGDVAQQQTAVNKILSQSGVYAVAHNDLHTISDDHHPFTLYVQNRDPFMCSDIKAVVSVLMTLWEMAA